MKENGCSLDQDSLGYQAEYEDGEKVTYIKEVKKRLRMRRDELKEHYSLELSINQMVKVMWERYKVRTTPSKLAAMFDPADQRSISLPELVAACEVLGLNLSEVTALTIHNPEEFSVWRKTPGEPRKTGVAPIDNPFYFGRYFGYYFRPKKFSGQLSGEQSESEVQPIWVGELEIQKIGERTRAKFLEQGQGERFDQSGQLPGLELTGDVYLLGHMNQVYVLLSDETGNRHMNMLFNYYNLSKDVLYFKIGSVLSVSVNQYRRPVFQRMALFREKLNLEVPEIEEVLRGILTMSDDELLVEAEKFEQMKKDDPMLSQFHCEKKSYYVFNEPGLFYQRTAMSYNQKAERIMKLKNASTAAAIHTVEEQEGFSQYAKALQKLKE